MLSHRGNLVLFIRFSISLFLLMPWNVYSQGIDNLWLSGYSSIIYNTYGGTNIDFRSGFTDTSTVDRPMSFSETNANISDSLGNLLFYSNGKYIANSLNDTMVNGSNLNPNAYTTQATYGLAVKQGNLILPMPGTPNIYYLFHESLFRDQSVGDYRVSELYYSIIDMSLDSGRGAVTQKNVILLSDTLTIGSITACKHANGRDWWIVFHKSRGRRYYEYLFTPSGLQGPYLQDIGYSILARDWSWQSCFSPDGNKYASVFTKDTFDIMNFDRCTGLFSNCISTYLKDSANARGIAFSSNSERIYISSATYVYQYSLNSNPVDSTKIKIGTFDGYADPIPPLYTGFYLAQLAVDGKVYISTGNGTRWLSVINNPDSFGFKSNFVQHSLLLPTFSINTIPNFPNYFLGRESGSICDSLPSLVATLNSKIYRINKVIAAVRVVSDNRGEAISLIKDEYDERYTYSYFLRKTIERIKK